MPKRNVFENSYIRRILNLFRMDFSTSNFTVLDSIFLALPDNSHDNTQNRELLTLSR